MTKREFLRKLGALMDEAEGSRSSDVKQSRIALAAVNASMLTGGDLHDEFVKGVVGLADEQRRSIGNQ